MERQQEIQKFANRLSALMKVAAVPVLTRNENSVTMTTTKGSFEIQFQPTVRQIQRSL